MLDEYKTLKSKSYYEALKKKMTAKYGKLWRKISGRVYVGDCSYLYKKLKPLNYQDFFDKYTAYTEDGAANGLIKSRYYGRSISDLFALAAEYKHMADEYGEYFTIGEFFDDIVNHVIIETFDGQRVERYVENILKEKGFTVNETYGKMDAEFGVDLVVIKDGILVSYIQIKPISTFLGSDNQSLISDRKEFYRKQDKLNEYVERLIEKGDTCLKVKPIVYMLYDKNIFNERGDILFYYKNGNPKFDLTSLCDIDGKSLLEKKTLDLKKLVLKY